MAEPEAPGSGATGEPRNIPARHILVVEDDPFTRSLLSRVLENAGFTVTTACTPAEAVQGFTSTDPDAVILDVHLGEGMSGVDLANRFRVETPGLAIIAVSNYPNPTSAGLPRRLPKDSAFINKAAILDAQSLLDVVEAALRNQGGEVRMNPETMDTPMGRLSGVHMAVLRMLAQGLSNAEIAQQRGSTVRSVERAVHKVFAELGLNARPDISPRVEAVKMYASVFGMPPPR